MEKNLKNLEKIDKYMNNTTEIKKKAKKALRETQAVHQHVKNQKYNGSVRNMKHQFSARSLAAEKDEMLIQQIDFRQNPNNKWKDPKEKEIKSFLKGMANHRVNALNAGFMTAYNPKKRSEERKSGLSKNSDGSKSSMSSASPLGDLSSS